MNKETTRSIPPGVPPRVNRPSLSDEDLNDLLSQPPLSPMSSFRSTFSSGYLRGEDELLSDDMLVQQPLSSRSTFSTGYRGSDSSSANVKGRSEIRGGLVPNVPPRVNRPSLSDDDLNGLISAPPLHPLPPLPPFSVHRHSDSSDSSYNSEKAKNQNNNYRETVIHGSPVPPQHTVKKKRSEESSSENSKITRGKYNQVPPPPIYVQIGDELPPTLGNIRGASSPNLKTEDSWTEIVKERYGSSSTLRDSRKDKFKRTRLADLRNERRRSSTHVQFHRNQDMTVPIKKTKMRKTSNDIPEYEEALKLKKNKRETDPTKKKKKLFPTKLWNKIQGGHEEQVEQNLPKPPPPPRSKMNSSALFDQGRIIDSDQIRYSAEIQKQELNKSAKKEFKAPIPNVSIRKKVPLPAMPVKQIWHDDETVSNKRNSGKFVPDEIIQENVVHTKQKKRPLPDIPRKTIPETEISPQKRLQFSQPQKRNSGKVIADVTVNSVDVADPKDNFRRVPPPRIPVKLHPPPNKNYPPPRPPPPVHEPKEDDYLPTPRLPTGIPINMGNLPEPQGNEKKNFARSSFRRITNLMNKKGRD
eukprot:TRINITY_DN3184_c0_g1_i1.p1 TRINITY_DN3184_c0_g1~~TRINITY_DN3184_c0_g1_i1.p1  ORF type:complete len:583 (-),score=128.12 TRINITY_DN3184_c0_g1_i1:38-1786(-)